MRPKTVLYVTSNESIAQMLKPVFDEEVGLSLSTLSIRSLLTRNESAPLDCVCFMTDMRIPHYNELNAIESKKGECTGEVLYARVRKNNMRLPIIILMDEGQTASRMISDGSFQRRPKMMSPIELACLVASLVQKTPPK